MSAQAPQDQIGAFPSEYDTDALPERRTAAFARMAIVIATVEAFVIMVMAFAFAALLPLQKVVPMVITSNDKGNEIVHLNPATLESPTVDYVAEINLRNYVIKRYSIVGTDAEQGINWGPGSPVQLMMKQDAYDRFRTEGTIALKELRAAGKTRTIRIDSVRKLNPATWQVEYTATDETAANPLAAPGAAETHAWVSTFQITFEPKNVTYSDRLNNPFGMTIISSSDARRD